MRKLAITQNITLDGRIEMLDDWFDPNDQDAELLAELMRQSASEEYLLLGRQTFEDFRGYWPKQTDDTTGITAHLNQVTKVAVSSSMTDPDWENSTVAVGDPVAIARDLKQGEGGDIVVTGSITLCHALLFGDVVDELRLFYYPVVQGRGRRLFPKEYAVPRLRLLDVQQFTSGVTYAAYSLLIDKEK
ncbi:dihydrofolate reductase [Epidermidibacterium keratini]|uniref:Dihydrofolate reductase n=1 Tax=Epidermidibacterium keratini TaxID=1891644 RepID=A0A7L4YMH8_9ACTN|nr:dihydrofolate reductase family protein [Epidermidibacterium keratini]QHC00262.1 dihydrofolate reductase [Epidermidibacterium keratini]